MKLYKYSDIGTAKLILESESVLLNTPKNFNDPFDSKIEINDKNKDKTLKLATNYSFFIYIYDSMKLTPFLSPVLKQFKDDFSHHMNKTLESGFYNEFENIDEIIKQVNGLTPKMKKVIEKSKRDFEKNVVERISMIRDDARISCFSKNNNSILMWGHYGGKHEGVCIEFEDDRHFFKEVNYVDERFYLDLYKLTSRMLAYKCADKELTYKDGIFRDIALEPFYTKAKAWEYEEEVRCLLSNKEEKTEGYYVKDNKTFLKMKITKVYIGIKAKSKEISDIIKLAKEKNIPIVHMEEDSKRYAIIPK